MSNKPEQMPIEEFLTAGQLLKKARCAKNLTCEDVANQIHLSCQQVHEIEEDNFVHISARIYAIGYLKTYANRVGLDEQLVIDAFNHSGVFQDPPREMVSSAVYVDEMKSHRSKKHVVGWIGFVLAIVLISLVIAWWHNQKTLSKPSHLIHLQKAVTISKPIQPIKVPASKPQADDFQPIAPVKSADDQGLGIKN